MDKLIALSIIFAMVGIPSFFARSPSPRRGLIRALVGVFIFVVLYALALIFIVADLIETTPPPSMWWLQR